MFDLALADVPHTPPAETVRRASKLVSSKVGLVRQINRGVHQAQDPAIIALGATPADLSRHVATMKLPASGSAGATLEAALAAVLGESAERYCMLHYDRREMVVASWEELGDDAVSPEMARLFSKEQVSNGLAPSGLCFFDAHTRVAWVWGRSLTAARPRLVPASLVYLGYRPENGEAAIGSNASSGLAAGATIEEAILSGLLECVERDAFTIAWMHRRLSRRIEIDDPLLRAQVAQRFLTGRPQVDLRIFDLELDLEIPCAFALLRRPADFGTALCIGCSARLDPKAAVVKALHETAQEFPFLRFLVKSREGWQPREDFSDLETFEDHCLLYVKRPELIPQAFAFCDGVETHVALSELEDRSTGRVLSDIETCVEKLAKRGFEVIVVEITTPDVRAAGLRVVRVLVPGLAQLHGHHRRPFLGVRRLHEIAERVGFRSPRAGLGSGFNPFPHPFP